MKKTILLGMVLPLLVTTPALAQKTPSRSPTGTWRCAAPGNIPIGVMTITGTAYKFQVVSNSVWAPKPSDRGNGSGQFKLAPGNLTPVSGSLVSVYKITKGEHSETKTPRDTYEAIFLYDDPKSQALLTCHRPS